MENRSYHLGVRLSDSEHTKLEQDAQKSGLKKLSKVARVLIDRASALDLLTVAPEQFQSEADLIRKYRDHLAKFKATAGPVLRDHWNLANEIHEDWLLTEQAGDNPGFVINVVSAFERGEDVESILRENNESFFANPRKAGSEYYEIARRDLIGLELLRGKGDIAAHHREYVEYVTSAVERANLRERHVWHRRLLSELALAGVDYRSMFEWSPSDHMYRLVDKPRLREVISNGRLTLEIGDPPAPKPARAPAQHTRPLSGKLIGDGE